MGIRFLAPVEGDLLLTGADGTLCGKQLCAPVRVAAPEGNEVTVNGVAAQWKDGAYEAQVLLNKGANTLTACADGESAEIRVWWLKGAEKKYRFTVDDCIRCFENITAHADEYKSIFEDPYLNVYWQAHEKYGSRVHINVFYESVDGKFNLSMMTDRFRDEFIANSDWLTFTFHSYAEFPDAPYVHTDYDTVKQHCELITKEIIRFAGEEVLRKDTTVHWGSANAEGVRALHDCGFRALSGYLCFDSKGDPLVAYYLNKEQTAHAEKREGWVDFEKDIIHVKLDFVLNADEFPAERVAPYLDELSKIPHEGQLIQMVIHEQYFYEDYFHHEPDYADRILNMAKWMYEHGYESVSLTGLLEEEA